MTHATGPAHLARATFKAIAQQIADVLEAMEADIGQPVTILSADGGASGNSFLMQLQPVLIDRPVETSGMEENGAIGVAGMAFAALGSPLPSTPPTRRFTPQLNAQGRSRARTLRAAAIAQATR